jgi:hypothetical protein
MRPARSLSSLALVRVSLLAIACRFFGLTYSFQTGGHTYESLALVGKMNPARYTPRLYIYCEGDVMSLKRVAELEATISASLTPVSRSTFPTFKIPPERRSLASMHQEDAAATKFSTLSLPRARRVGQPFISSGSCRTIVISIHLMQSVPL